MEREFALNIVEEQLGQVCLSWDELRLSAYAVCSLRGEGMIKLWLAGERGRLLLGTLIPERGRLTLRRVITLAEVKRSGAWPPERVESALIWPFRADRPFPRPDLFCFTEVKGEWGKILFREDGWPIFPE